MEIVPNCVCFLHSVIAFDFGSASAVSNALMLLNCSIRWNWFYPLFGGSLMFTVFGFRVPWKHVCAVF